MLIPLIQQQLEVGEFVKGAGIKSADAVIEITGKVLGRASDWISLYAKNIDNVQLDEQAKERATAIETELIEAAKAEAMHGADVWNGDFSKAREVLESGIEKLSRVDDVVAGWHNLQIGGCYEYKGDRASALINYQRARGRLGVNFAIPKSLTRISLADAAEVGRMQRVLDLVTMESPTAYAKQFNRWKLALNTVGGGTYSQVEEGIGEPGGASRVRSQVDRTISLIQDRMYCGGIRKRPKSYSSR